MKTSVKYGNLLTGNMTTMEISQICYNLDHLTEPVYSAENAMRLHFLTDDSFGDLGFLAIVTAVPRVYLLR